MSCGAREAAGKRSRAQREVIFSIGVGPSCHDMDRAKLSKVVRT